MIVISDGDLIRNQLIKTCNPSSWDTINVPETYMTTRISCWIVSITLDDTGLINIRSKDLDLPLLDKEKVLQIMQDTSHNYRLPLLILVLFGVVFTYLRKRKYGQ
jgi:hypothetical protein